MPFKLPQISGRTSNEPSKQQEASLDDILPNRDQRIDLILLVSLCAEQMRDNFVAVFGKPGQAPAPSEKSIFLDRHDEQFDDPEWRTSSRNLVVSKMEDLKTKGILHYDTWSGAVVKRLGKALSISMSSVKLARSDYLVCYQKGQVGDTVTVAGAFPQTGPQRARKITEGAGLRLPLPRIDLPKSIQLLDEKKRALVLGAVLFILLSLEKYPAQSRTLMTYLCICLNLPYDVLSSEEATVAATLLDAASKAGSEIDAEDARKKEADQGAFGRKWKIGLATVAGAAVIGISGGLAAPLILGVAGSVLGGIGLGGFATLLGATIANPLTIAALFGALGGRMTGRAMEVYSREVEDFKFLPLSEIKPISTFKNQTQPGVAAPAHKLRVAIGISGWVTKESDVSLPWRALSSTAVEPFALRYEQAALIALGTTLDQVIKDSAYSYVQSYAIKLALPTLATAMAPIGLLQSGKFLDNPFSIAIDRSDKAGRVLAHALIEKAQGERPVTLIGFSMGARVVLSCLEELAAQSAFGLVENAIFIGSPVPSNEALWRRMRAMVSGRLINVYTQRDLILGFLYRARNAQLGIAGLQAIDSVPHVENEDVSNIVAGHNQYRLAVGRILREIDFADIDLDQLEQEKAELEHENAYEKEMYEEGKRDGRLKNVEDEYGEIIMGHDGRDGVQRAHSNDLPKQLERMPGGKAGEEQKPMLRARPTTPADK